MIRSPLFYRVSTEKVPLVCQTKNDHKMWPGCLPGQGALPRSCDCCKVIGGFDERLQREGLGKTLCLISKIYVNPIRRFELGFKPFQIYHFFTHHKKQDFLSNGVNHFLKPCTAFLNIGLKGIVWVAVVIIPGWDLRIGFGKLGRTGVVFTRW